LKNEENLFYELEETLSKESFDKFTTSESLHYLAQNWSWETREELQIIRWISESNLCSQATALMIFWLAQPEDYTKYKLGAKVPYDNGVFAIIKTILNRFEKDDYQNCSIYYDPQDNMPRGIEIDEKMKLAVLGEETWYDDDYVKKISGYVISELSYEIRNCKDNNYLNMIANGLLHFFNHADKIGEWIVENPYCDRGTALLLYWRLLSYFQRRGFSPQETKSEVLIVQQLHDKLISDFFPTSIGYSPTGDKQNDILLGKQKRKWEIPAFMKQPTSFNKS